MNLSPEDMLAIVLEHGPVQSSQSNYPKLSFIYSKINENLQPMAPYEPYAIERIDFNVGDLVNIILHQHSKHEAELKKYQEMFWNRPIPAPKLQPKQPDVPAWMITPERRLWLDLG